MASKPQRDRRGARLKACAGALVALLSCVLPAVASGAESTPANYRVGGLQFGVGSPIGNCRGWSGDADANGHFYIPCAGDSNPLVYEFDANFTFVRAATLPAAYLYDGSYRMRDVAITPDGTTMYVSTGPIIDNLGADPVRNESAYAGAVLRMRRQADGSWVWDPSFRTGPYQLAGNYWGAREIDVDASGRLYVAVNAFVYQIDPATGAVASSFGGVATNGANGTWREGIDVAHGMAVAPDGSWMFVVEQRHNLLQRWYRIGATDWKRDTTWGPNGNGLIGEPSVVDASYCSRSDRLQSPYDVGVDGVGDVYVMDTGCRRLQRFTAAGAFVQTVWANGSGEELNHGIAVNWQGSVILPNLERAALRLDPPTAPIVGGGPRCEDAAPPTIRAVSIPARTTSRTLQIAVTADDDCSGVAAVSVRGAIAESGTWVDGTKLTVTLSGTNGSTPLTISVRDASKQVASVPVRVQLALPQPPLRSRLAVALAGRGCRVGNPLARVASPKSYRVVDRCAQFVGRVVSIRGKGRSQQLELQLDLRTSQALYTNAIGPVRIWVVSDAKTRRTGRAATVGRNVSVLGTIVAQRNRRASFAIPTDAVRGR